MAKIVIPKKLIKNQNFTLNDKLTKNEKEIISECLSHIKAEITLKINKTKYKFLKSYLTSENGHVRLLLKQYDKNFYALFLFRRKNNKFAKNIDDNATTRQIITKNLKIVQDSLKNDTYEIIETK